MKTESKENLFYSINYSNKLAFWLKPTFPFVGKEEKKSNKIEQPQWLADTLNVNVNASFKVGPNHTRNTPKQQQKRKREYTKINIRVVWYFQKWV